MRKAQILSGFASEAKSHVKMRVLVALVGLLMVAHSDGIAVTPTLELRAPPPAAAVTRVLGYPRYTHIHTQRHGTATACMALPPTQR